jgi:hypothetical protein
LNKNLVVYEKNGPWQNAGAANLYA